MAGPFDVFSQFLPQETIKSLNESVFNTANNVLKARMFSNVEERDSYTPADGEVILVNNKMQHYSNGAWRNADGTLT